MFNKVHPTLHGQFEQYFFKERVWRFDLNKWKEDVEAKVSKILDEKNLAACGKFLSDYSESVRPAHRNQCSDGITNQAGDY